MGLQNKLLRALGRVQCLSGYTLKVIAVVCMVIDHFGKTIWTAVLRFVLDPMIGAGVLPASMGTWGFWLYKSIMVPIGAVAFPLFAFALVEGYCHTRSKKRYALRLSVFALLSEIPFDLAFFEPFFWHYQNVFVTFLMGLGTMALLEYFEKLQKPILGRLLQVITIASMCALAEFVVNGDYGGYGIFLISVLYLLRKNRMYQLAGMTLIPLIVYNRHPISYFTAIVLIALYNGQRGKMNLKYFFYWFYPAHILLFYAGRLFVRWLGR